MPTRTLLSLALALCLTGVAQAAFPGKNGRIAFDRYHADQGAVFAIGDLRPSGTGVRTLLRCYQVGEQAVQPSCPLGPVGQPSYSPDGRRIVFDAGAKIGVMSNGGSGLRLYPVPTDDVAEPAFSPDGNQVVFTHPAVQGDGEGDLYILDLRAAAAHQLVRRASKPAWSSRNRIAFARGQNVYSIGPDGTGLKALTRKGGGDPEWSPSGRQIAFARGSYIYIARPGSGRIRRLRGTGRITPASPAWSPDGKLIAYMDFENLNVVQTNGGATVDSWTATAATLSLGATARRAGNPSVDARRSQGTCGAKYPRRPAGEQGGVTPQDRGAIAITSSIVAQSTKTPAIRGVPHSSIRKQRRSIRHRAGRLRDRRRGRTCLLHPVLPSRAASAVS